MATSAPAISSIPPVVSALRISPTRELSGNEPRAKSRRGALRRGGRGAGWDEVTGLLGSAERCRPDFPALPAASLPSRRPPESAPVDASGGQRAPTRRQGSVLGLAGVETGGDQVHDRGVGEGGDVADLAVL